MYAYVGLRIGRRSVAPEAKLPLLSFATWWHALASVTCVGALAAFLAAVSALDPDLYVALTYSNLFVLSVGLAGLLHYLLFLFTGRHSWWKVLVPAYYAYAVFLTYFIRSHSPTGYAIKGWTVSTTYEVPLQDDPLFMVVIVLLLVPQIGAAAAYLTLAFRTREHVLRYRIAVVSLALMLWFGSALGASVSHLGDSDAWQIASRAIGLLAALAVLAAYFPPRPLRKRFGLVAIDQPVAQRP